MFHRKNWLPKFVTNAFDSLMQWAKKPSLSESAKVESVFHPSDFSEASEAALAHALKIALVAKATLHMLANLPVGSMLG